MEAGASIRVLTPDTLEIEQTTLRACDTLWRGIEMKDRALLEIKESSLIEGALQGVFGTNYFLKVSNSTFDRNFVGITNAPPSVIHFRLFQSNLFDCSADLLLPYPGMFTEPGLPPNVEQRAYAAAVLHRATGTLDVNGNTFQNLTNGLLITNSNLLVQASAFRNMSTGNGYGAFTEGVGIEAVSESGAHVFRQKGFGQGGAASFLNCRTAVRLQNFKVEQLESNTMDAVHTGVEIRGASQEVNIRKNDIDAGTFGILLKQIDPKTNLTVEFNQIQLSNAKARGISLHQTSLSLTPGTKQIIRSNEVHLSTNFSQGIHLEAAGGTQVLSNEVDATQGTGFSGIRIQGSVEAALLCNSVLGFDPASGTGIAAWNAENTAWRCNNIGNTENGVYVLMGGHSPDNFIGT
ncbi:MAG: hypothetical protein D6765_09435, partial [Bacteroidetes bacterium]